jgi:hypothetical protein
VAGLLALVIAFLFVSAVAAFLVARALWNLFAG